MPIDTSPPQRDVARYPRGVPRKGLRVRKPIRHDGGGRAVTLRNLIRVMPA